MIDCMKNSILRFLDKHPPAKLMFSDMLSSGELYLIGGVLREYLDHRSFDNLRDIDIIVNVKNAEKWRETIQKYSIKTNRFGGSTLKCDGFIVDAWPVDQTWAYRQNLVSCGPDDYFDNLPKTVFLNIDGIVFDWQRNVWNDEEYQSAMKSKILDIVLPENPLLCLNILRTFILQDRYHMGISDRLRQVIINEYNCSQDEENFVNTLMAEQFRRYGREVLSRHQIEEKMHLLIT